MIRQQSSKNAKVASRDRATPTLQPLIVKTDGGGSQRESAGKSREKRGSREGREGKKESVGKEKVKEKRSSVQTEAVLMKKDLRMLMNRNNPARTKPADPTPIPTIPTKQNPKELPKSTKPALPPKKQQKSKEPKPHPKSDKSKFSSKRCSHQETLQPTPAISITRNIPTHPQPSETQRQTTERPTRRSLDPTSNPIGVRRAQIEQALKIKPPRRPEGKEPQNFIQIFKNYKKHFEVTQFNLQGQGNQSNRLSATSHNSQLTINKEHSRADDRERERDREGRAATEQSQEGSGHIDAVVREAMSLISQQSSCNLRNETDPSEDRQAAPKRKRTKPTIDIPQPKKPTSYFQRPAIVPQMQPIIIQNLPAIEQKPQIQKQSNESTTHNKENDCNEGKNIVDREKVFQASKYYVQPLPVRGVPAPLLPTGKQQSESSWEGSLLGCQITLIENNIFEDEAELDL